MCNQTVRPLSEKELLLVWSEEEELVYLLRPKSPEEEKFLYSTAFGTLVTVYCVGNLYEKMLQGPISSDMKFRFYSADDLERARDTAHDFWIRMCDGKELPSS